ncbi:MAG: acyl-CoA thioesterase [Thermoleophilia bacterium]|nr:acyl-CoA thioesterase [Thermoleophilia bacterium]
MEPDLDAIHAAALAPPGETRMMRVVMPEMLNHHGTMFGGQALAMMDVAGFVAATRHCRAATVTAKVNDVEYLAPVREGDIVEVAARVVSVGRTSMVVLSSMVAEHLTTGERALAGRGRFVFVALDEDGRPAPVPPLGE